MRAVGVQPMKKIFTPILFILILIGCSQKVTEEVLIDGTWIATSGYEDGEEKGDPDCYPFEEGIQFKEDTVFVETSGKDIEYLIYEIDSTITFFHNLSYSHEIKKISNNS